MKKGINKCSAFTLVELSIVIIIIGFLIAGISAGQSLIKQAALNGVISELSQFHTAMSIFKSKYSGLPGDIPNASAYWPNCDAIPANCDGDNDGLIDSDSEFLRAWQQLAAAGLINGSYTGSGTKEIGINIPGSKLGSDVGYLLYNWGYPPWGNCIESSPRGGNCAWQTINICSGTDPFACAPVMTTTDIYNIDLKIDDGLARQGTIWTGGASGGYQVVMMVFQNQL